jgi:hypothetical protein
MLSTKLHRHRLSVCADDIFSLYDYPAFGSFSLLFFFSYYFAPPPCRLTLWVDTFVVVVVFSSLLPSFQY